MSVRSAYEPVEPYVVKSSKLKGKSVEVLMFNDYHSVVFMLARCKRTGALTTFCFHLDWVIKRGENRISKILCPHCRKKPIEFFTVISATGTRRDFAIMREGTACADCKEILEERFPEGNILPLKFSSLARFKKGSDYQQAKNFFKSVFRISYPFDKKEVFDFFKADGAPQK